MNKLKLASIAFPAAPKDVIKRGEEILKKSLQNIDITFDNTNPDAIFVISGGSESQAKSILKSTNKVLLLAMTENNSYAAATEIKSYCIQNNIDSVLYNIDSEKDLNKKIEYFIKTKNTLNKLKEYKIGLIGNVSDWLISSDIKSELLKEKFGISLEQIDWNDFDNYSTYPENNNFIDHFKESSTYDLKDSSKVYNLLQDIIQKRQLDAITVECFPLVVQNSVTACLALSLFNTHNIAAGCEGDITSITGKLIAKELTGQIPWMANLAGIEDDKVFLAHCTIATNLVSDYKINTHFETNKGTAVQGKFISEDITLLRFNNELNKAFISYGRIVERPERNDSCRTQIKVEISQNDINKLKETPLGNHHLVIPGNFKDKIRMFCELMNIEII